MESIYTELALYVSKDECARTDDVFSPISEVCDGTVSLIYDFISNLLSDLISDFGKCPPTRKLMKT